MNELITGVGGMIGTNLLATFADTSCIALTRNEVYITHEFAVHEAVQMHRPDVILNVAAYTNVDHCETEFDQAYVVNAVGARNMAVAAE